MAKSKQPRKDAKPLFELEYSLTQDEARQGLKLLDKRRDEKRGSRIIVGVLLVLALGATVLFYRSQFWWFPVLLWCLGLAVYLFYYWVRPARKREDIVRKIAEKPVRYALSFFPKGMRIAEGEQVYRIFYEKTQAMGSKEMLIFFTPELMIMTPVKCFSKEQLEMLFDLLAFSPEDQAVVTGERTGDNRIPG